jgi:2-hydroxychromene-2-carboxylate isomerase
MNLETQSVRFYFDYISSNAYLAWKVLPRLAARHGFTLEPVPVLFAGLLDAHGQMGPAELPAKALWMWKNNLRKAALLGVQLNVPAFHPFNPLLSLRVSSLDMPEADRTALLDALFDAVWVDGLHVSEADVVRDVADRIGLPGTRLVEQAQQPEAKSRLRGQTDAAIAAGVFGVPTMIVDGELFWGYDDLPYFEHCVAGTDPLDPDAVPTAETAPRPSSVRRQVRS